MITLTGKTLEFKCTEQLFPEFPEMLFGKQSDGSSLYFDASKFAESKGLSLDIDKFLRKYEGPIEALIDSLQLKEDEVCRLNNEGHILIESSLIYLYISFIDPKFLLYIVDRMDDLFSTGIALSDSFLAKTAKERIPKEIMYGYDPGN